MHEERFEEIPTIKEKRKNFTCQNATRSKDFRLERNTASKVLSCKKCKFGYFFIREMHLLHGSIISNYLLLAHIFDSLTKKKFSKSNLNMLRKLVNEAFIVGRKSIFR